MIEEYEALAALMREMLQSAQTRNWDKVSDLEMFYHDKMASIKTMERNTVLSKQAQARKLEIIKGILQDDHQIKSLIYPEMDQLSKLLTGGQNKAKLSRSYGI